MQKKIIMLSSCAFIFLSTIFSCQRQLTKTPQVSHDSGVGSSYQKLSSRYSIVYTDLDGTAIDTTGTVREATIKAVKAFQDRGGRISIATGRTLEQAQKAINQLNPNLPIVLFNGGVVVDLNKKSFEILGNLDAESMRECIKTISIDTIVYGLVLHFPNVSITDRYTPRFIDFAKNQDITLTCQDDLKSLSSDSLIKIVVFCDSSYTKTVRDKINNAFKNSNLRYSRVVISSKISVEVLPLFITKAAAIKKIAKQVGFSMDDVLAFGDSGNDVEMLREVGLGVVMWNGRPEAKEAADIIVGPNYSDSIAKFLNSPIMR